jgi:hypothetical protein
MSIERILAPLAEWCDGPSFPTEARVHSLVSGGPVWMVNDSERLRRWPIYSTQVNLHSARELGVEPLTLGEVLRHFANRWPRLVLFDTSPAAPDRGNHWLIKDWQEGKPEAVLAFYDPRAGLVYDHIEPFPMQLDEPPFFTGAVLIPSSLPGVEAGPLAESAGRLSEATVGFGPGEVHWSAGAQAYFFNSPDSLPAERFGYITPGERCQ